MTIYPKITLVTPSFNQVQFIEKTILSVLDQKYPNLEYIVIDGGSTDGTPGIIKKYQTNLTYWQSKPDSGMYHALETGFSMSTGDLMGWINADDILHPGSLFTLAQLFSNPEINWIQGYPNVIDELGRILFTRNPRWSKYEFYNDEFSDNVFVQQESTFWRRSLWNATGSRINTSLQLAGDFELWIRFFEIDHLYITNAMIGGFRRRSGGQLSSDRYSEYMAECYKTTSLVRQKLSTTEARLFAEYKRLLNLRKKNAVIRKLLGVESKLNAIKGFPKIARYNFSTERFDITSEPANYLDHYSNL